MLKKLNSQYKSEPLLKVHRYIVVIYSPKAAKKKFFYCLNRQEVRDLCKDKRKAPKGAVIEVFKAQHDFKEAYLVE